ncbi:hypothetical protein BCR36DRAFT_299101 [Piromyces finnis]|uniref:Uncharacterized protein n=1 Tax=Piromyces finnis TaxID=1754191 RepID=A0A1Y1V3K0_9FUNG|nr:hypothetical protein BCR36DRAFT_299101 [Piromyces finnis]|eukprot:ORX45603.1 hypothetical protein BCR36DRAFT_299101 [Piromyces finnis]
MENTKVSNSTYRNSSRNYLLDEDIKKDNLYNNKKGSLASLSSRNFNNNYQKPKKIHEVDSDIPSNEHNEIVRLPSIINENAIKPPQYIAYTGSNINGEVILKDLTGELWVQPSNSILSMKSENRLKSEFETTNISHKSKDDDKKSESNNLLKKIASSNKDEDNLLPTFDNNYKRNFDKYLSDVQKLIEYAKNPVFDYGSTQNISIDIEKEKRKRKTQNNNFDPGSADSQKISINGRKPIRVINLELEMKLDNLRNNDIERENFERKIEAYLQNRKIQKINFDILMNNKKIKKIGEIKKLKNDYIERYNQHIVEVLKKERKLLYQRLDKITKNIDYKNACSEMEKEREVGFY